MRVFGMSDKRCEKLKNMQFGQEYVKGKQVAERIANIRLTNNGEV